MERAAKMISSLITGAEEIVAPISRGDLKYCRGVASILKPHALYNSRSAIVKNERKVTRTKV